MSIADHVISLLAVMGNNDPTRESIIAQSSLINQISNECKKTPLFQQGQNKFAEFIESVDADPNIDKKQVLVFAWNWMLTRIVDAPTRFHREGSLILTLPVIAHYLPK